MSQQTSSKVHEIGSRLGVAEPTIQEQIKFEGEKIITPTTQQKLEELDTQTHGVPVGRELDADEENKRVTQRLKEGSVEYLTTAKGVAHEIGARVGLVEPTMKEEIKFGAEKVQGGGWTLQGATEKIWDQGAQVWNTAKGAVQGIGAKVGLVAPAPGTMEEIKMEAERPNVSDKVAEVAERVQERGDQVWDDTKNVGHELGARAGIVEPTMKEEIKFGAEKMQYGVTPTVAGAKEIIQDQGSQAWDSAKDKAHEVGARVGVVDPTLKEEIKFGAEKIQSEQVKLGKN